MSEEKPRVVVADPIEPDALAELSKYAEVFDASREPGTLRPQLELAQGLLVRSRTRVDSRMLMEEAPRLRVIGRAGVGVDNIDVATATRRGIPVVNAPAAATASVAELTMGLLVAVARDFGSQIPAVKAGEWKKAGNGMELSGRTLGFVGYGRIAREVAVRAKAFGMKVQAHDPFLTESPDGTPLLPLDRLLATSDVVSLHANLTPENRHLINATTLARMRKGAILLNVARGALVDEEALLAALESGHLAGAGLDVFEDEPPRRAPLLAHPKVGPLPHIGASTREAQRRAGLVTVEEMAKVLQGRTPQFCVNPEVLRR